ncbi:hypothetical protein KI387_009893, partial [Taxus chinensis]
MGTFSLSIPSTISVIPPPKLESNEYGGGIVRDFVLLVEQHQHGFKQLPNTYADLLQKCAINKALLHGKCLHSHAIKSAVDSNTYFYNNLLNMYAKCGSLDDARQVFDNIPKRNKASWTAMIAGYAQNGYFKTALQLFCQMQRDGVHFNEFAFGSALKACAGMEVLEFGRQVQAQIIMSGLESDYIMGCALIDMYCKCGSLENACQVFDEMTAKDVVSWTAMIAGYTHNGYGEEALKLYCRMQRK